MPQEPIHKDKSDKNKSSNTKPVGNQRDKKPKKLPHSFDINEGSERSQEDPNP